MKPMLQILAGICVFAVLFGGAVSAQSPTPNLATSATCTHSGGGSGTYGPQLYNDGVIPNQGSLPWGWTSAPSTGAYIQFTWSTPQTMDEMTLYYAEINNRYMSGCTIQYLSGTSWITAGTFAWTSPWTVWTRTFTFTPVSSTALRIYDITMAPTGQTSNPDFREIEIRSRKSGPNDAGVLSIDSPLNFCAGTYPIQATIGNFGTNQITSVTINWSLNGTPQTPINWTGLMDTIPGASWKQLITLNPSYNFLSGVPYTIMVSTSMPNGVPDTINANDQMTVTRSAALAGTFTIGGSMPDYTNFKDAVDDLVTNGLCGPVVFNVRPGAYNENIEIGNIAGAGPVNTITFQGQTGNPADVQISYSATSYDADNYVLRYTSAEYVTFKDMTLNATSASYGRVVYYNGSDHCTIQNLVMNGYQINTTSNYHAVLYAYNSANHNAVIEDCTINNGGLGVYWYTNSPYSRDVRFENNTIQNFYYANFWYYTEGLQFLHNTIRTASTYTNYGAYIYYPNNAAQIIGNKVTLNGAAGTKYGLMCYYSSSSASNPTLVANNFISVSNGGSTAYGMYAYGGAYVDYRFNTIYVNSTSTSSRCIYSGYSTYNNFTNNIIHMAGNGYAWYAANTGPTYIASSDYNVFFTNGPYVGYYGGNRVDLAAWQAGSGLDGNSIWQAPNYTDAFNGDLHLDGGSENDPSLYGNHEPQVTDDIDFDTRVLPYRGADEACYIVPNSVWYDVVDASGIQTPYANVPGVIGIWYHVEFPEFDAVVTVNVKLYSIPGNILTYTGSFQVNKAFGVPLDGYQTVNLTGVPVGVYRVEVSFNTKNSCGGYIDYSMPNDALMLLPTGQIPCLVWPGDVNNDGLVNYGDRKSLNTYIHDANLDPTWLNGPPRYRADAAQNPLTYITWEAQAAIPWATPEGCYMDSDGNGTVNSWDYISMKTNWMRNHDVGPKNPGTFSASTFDVSQNFPNPFNPSTQINYTVPEISKVRIDVYDLEGSLVATLVDDTKDAGTYTLTFDASQLSSGIYIAVASLEGQESGLTFDKTIRMQLTK